MSRLVPFCRNRTFFLTIFIFLLFVFNLLILRKYVIGPSHESHDLLPPPCETVPKCSCSSPETKVSTSPKDINNLKEKLLDTSVLSIPSTSSIYSTLSTSEENELLYSERSRGFKIQKKQYSLTKVKTCPDLHTRDYTTSPLRVHEVGGPDYYGSNCPVNCAKVANHFPAEITKNTHTKACGYYTFMYTMENRGAPADISGTTSLTSHVPLPYYSWIDFSFMEVPEEKTEGSMMAAFISNCGPKRRLEILKELQKYGVTVDSYGGCLNNKKEPKLDPNKQYSKYLLIKKYKFTYSAENSYTDDYVTEKFFLPLTAGSVPVYLGAPNINHFRPSKKSIININDYGSIKELAEHIIELSNDEEKYNEYMEWKYKGPSRHFLSVMDFPIYHSCCRLCMKAADFIRVEYNNTVGHQKIDYTKARKKRYFKIRERNTFYLKYIYLNHNFSMSELENEIRNIFQWNDVYKIYMLWDYSKIPLYIEEIRKLPNGEELEVVFLDSMKMKRAKFTDWDLKNNKKSETKRKRNKDQYIKELEDDINRKTELFKKYLKKVEN